MQFSRRLRPLGIAIALLACVSLPALAKETITLGSGTSVEIEGSEPIKTNGWNAVAVTYQTKLKLGDKERLRREADEVWEKLAPGAENGDYAQAVIEATAPTTKGQDAPLPVTFVYQRKDGAWRGTDFAKDEPPALTQQNVSAMIRRADEALELDEMNAGKLYLATDWTATVTYLEPGTTTMTTKDINVDEYDRLIAEARANSSNYHHNRTITGITIASDGQTAEVKSAESEMLEINGKQIDKRVASIDTVALDNGNIVIAKSISDEIR